MYISCTEVREVLLLTRKETKYIFRVLLTEYDVSALREPDKNRLHAPRSRFGRSVVVSDVILVSLVLSTSRPSMRFDVTYVTSDVLPTSSGSIGLREIMKRWVLNMVMRRCLGFFGLPWS